MGSRSLTTTCGLRSSRRLATQPSSCCHAVRSAVFAVARRASVRDAQSVGSCVCRRHGDSHGDRGHRCRVVLRGTPLGTLPVVRVLTLPLFPALTRLAISLARTRCRTQLGSTTVLPPQRRTSARSRRGRVTRSGWWWTTAPTSAPKCTGCWRPSARPWRSPRPSSSRKSCLCTTCRGRPSRCQCKSSSSPS